MSLPPWLYIWKPIVEIAILWYVLYHIVMFLEGTRAKQVLTGIVIIFVSFLLFRILNLLVLEWLVTKLFAMSVLAALIIFHPEIRQGLARLGQGHFFPWSLREEEWEKVLGQIYKATESLAKAKIGALIALENEDSLSSFSASGVLIDANVSSELLQAIFTPHNPLHDGGVVIRNGRVVSAGCLFPLTQKQDINRIFGTRHRAALGLGEETDAIIIVVSEERQDVSLVYGGRLYKDLGKEEIVRKIKEIIQQKKNVRK